MKTDKPTLPKAVYFPSIRLLDPSTGRDEVGAFFVNDAGRIAAVPEKLPPKSRLLVIDTPGLTLMPGLCDVHVHYRDPGMTDAEDLLSGSCASANGGFTRVVTMPNTKPVVDTPELLRRQAQGHFPVTIYPSACASLGRAGKVPSALEVLASAGAVAFTDDGAMVYDSDLMKTIMLGAKELNRCVMDHAVIPSLAKQGMIRDCAVAHALDLPIFPASAEVEAVRADIDACRQTGCALHIQHLSCAESVTLIREAQAEGLPVTGEVTPHHLAIAAEDIPGDDGNYRMNPPLGLREDVEALRAGLLDGTLTVFATDHAPHPRLSKSRGFRLAPFGVVGAETAVGVSWTVMVRELGMSPLDWARNWIVNPNRLINKSVPTLEMGQKAEFSVFDFEQPWKVDPDNFVSKSTNTPFVGWKLYGQAHYTYRCAKLRPTVLPYK